MDDSSDSAESLAILMRHLGGDVRTAYDGVEALAAIAEFRPHTVLLDIGLPRMSGHEVARRVRAEPWGSQIRLVALTGWAQDEDVRRSLEAGFDLHLVKPVALSDLRRLMSADGPSFQGSAPQP